MTFEVLKKDYCHMVTHLSHQRDELKLQAHLFSMEAKQQWELAEQHWHHLRAKAKVIGAEASHSGGEIKGSMEEVVLEIGAAYERLRRLL